MILGFEDEINELRVSERNVIIKTVRMVIGNFFDCSQEKHTKVSKDSEKDIVEHLKIFNKVVN